MILITVSLILFYDHRKGEQEPDEGVDIVALTAMIKLCVRTKCGLVFLPFLSSRFFSVSFLSSIRFFCSRSCWRFPFLSRSLCFLFFSFDLSTRIARHDSLILCVHRDFPRALRFFREMLKRDIVPDSSAYANMLAVCAKTGHPLEGREILNVMRYDTECTGEREREERERDRKNADRRPWNKEKRETESERERERERGNGRTQRPHVQR